MSSIWAHLAPLALGFIGGLVHRALTVRADQLKVKTKLLPETLRPLVQEELQRIVPQVAQQLQTWADNAIQQAAQRLEGASAQKS